MRDQAHLQTAVVVTLGATTCSNILKNFCRMLINIATIYHRLQVHNIIFNLQSMAQTDRNQLLTPTKTPSVYQEEFIDQVYLGCFTHKSYVVIKNRSLYVYDSKGDYKECPEKPKMFFNLNHMGCTLYEDFIQISNQFGELILKHREPSKIIELVEAINKGRVEVPPEQMYPEKYKKLSSGDLSDD